MNMLIRNGHGLCSSVVFSLLLLCLCWSNTTNYTKSWVSTWRTSSNISLLMNSALREENLRFAVWPTLNLAFNALENCSNNNGANFVIKKLLSSWSQWKKACLNGTIIVYPLLSLRSLECPSLKIKIKRAKRPCTFYSNSLATFHCLLEGDLVFKLNPGPLEKEIGNFQIQHTRPLKQSRNSANLISITCEPFYKISNSLSLCLLNAQSVKNKSANIFDYVIECKADLVAITETWLKSNHDVIRSELCPTGYKLLDHMRTGRRGGGTGLLFRDSLNVTKVYGGEKESFEFSEWLIQFSSSHSLRLAIIYRPQNDADAIRIPTSTFFSEFSEYLESVVMCEEQLIIVGDFNIHVDIPEDTETIKLLDLLESFCLQQHVEGPTHIHGHTLDLIITRQSDQIIQSAPCVDWYLSDHASVLCSLRGRKPPLNITTVSYRKWKSVNLDSLNADLANSDLCNYPPENLEELVSCYNKTLQAAMDKHAPLQTRTIVSRPRVPWYNDEIRQAKRDRRKAEKQWRRTKLHSDLAKFKIKRNTVTNLLNKARREFYTNFIAENSHDQRKLFRASKRLFNCPRDDGLPPNLNAPAFANNLGKYFVAKVQMIQQKVVNDALLLDVPSGPVTDTSTVKSNIFLSAFEKLSDSDVKSLMRRSTLKTCSLDPMPSRLVCGCDSLLPVISTIINKSLQNGDFPECWKEALVLPLLKKRGLDIIFKNFRPVSNLPFISKLSEKAVFDQTYNLMVKNDLYPPNQSSYRKNHSTETALLKITNDILLNMNKQHVTLLVLLDLSAAFDTVDHNILMSSLSVLGLGGTALEWFSSYLTGRSQRISVRGCQSESFNMNCGVPQGSCLGPLLFTIYTRSLFDIVKNQLPVVHCYADDTQLYVSFSPKNVTGQDDALDAMERCVEEIRCWMTRNRLMMNNDKTEFLLIGTQQQLAKVNINHVKVGSTNIAPTSHAKNLGVWFDSCLSMSVHITNACSASFFHLYNIRKISKYLSRECKETLIHSLVTSRLDYCNSLLYGSPAYLVKKLQRVQNAAARLIFQVSKFNHVTPLLSSLHWLPIKYRINFKLLIITYKAIHGLAPSYLCSLISVKKNERYNLRSSSGLLINYCNIKSLVTLGDRSFQCAAPKLWNGLPSEIRNCPTLYSFKKSLKTYLFKEAFG